MKKNIQLPAIVLGSLFMGFAACGPNGDKNSTDPANSNGEGAIDSTKLTPIDTTNMSTDTSTTYNYVPGKLSSPVTM